MPTEASTVMDLLRRISQQNREIASLRHEIEALQLDIALRDMGGMQRRNRIASLESHGGGESRMPRATRPGRLREWREGGDA